MIITCEQCKATYCIADKIVNSNMKLKCTRCGYIWKHFKSLSSVNEGNFSIKSIIKKTFSILSLTITILLLNFIFFPEFLMNFSLIKDLYNKCGIYDTNNLVLEDFMFSIEEGTLIAKGLIKNDSTDDKFFPDIRYILTDKDKNIIFKYTSKSHRPLIKAGESVPLYTKILNVNNNAAFLQIDIGNKLELLIK